MNRWKHIYFFDKNGKYFNFKYDETIDMWSGHIYLSEVSTGLFEVGQLFILQEFIHESSRTKKFGYPHTYDQNNASNWVVEWETSDPEDIFLFQFDLNFSTGTQSSLEAESIGPPIFKYDEIYIPLDYNESSISEDDYTITDKIRSETIQINFAINSDDENTFRRTLIIRDEATASIVGKFTVYAETVGEDERLKVMTENLGRNIVMDDSLIFKDTNIHESLPDFIEINRKRKELMMEGHNIYPYIGSYKGLVNAINFFGYNNLQIKEFWKNINKSSPRYGMYIQSNPINTFNPQVNYNDNSITLPNKNFRKTNMFSLVYRINKIKEGEYDFQDLPLTEEVFDYTIEEVLIKLFGLKRKLEKDFLPLNAHIRDITGEGDFFGLLNLTNTISRNDKRNIEVGIPVNFTVFPSSCTYLENIKPFLDFCFIEGATVGTAVVDFCNSFINPISIGSTTDNSGRNMVVGEYSQGDLLPSPPVGPDPNSILGKPFGGQNFSINDIADVYLSFFSGYSPNLNRFGSVIDGYSSLYMPDKPGVPVGALVVLQNDSFNSITWDDVDLTYNHVDNGNKIHAFDLNPQIGYPGDTFIINDPITNTGASYTVYPGDDNVKVRDELLAQLTELKSLFVLPWLHWDLSKVSLDFAGDAIRIFGNDTQRIQTKVDKISISGSVFNKFDNPSEILYTWDSIKRGNFSEIEWTIYKEETDISPEFFYTIRGPVSQLESLPLTLPYIGVYTVEMKLYDLYNNVSSLVKTDYICVEGKEIEYSGWYQSRKETYSWDTDGKWKWNDYGSIWNLPITPSTTWDEETPSLYDSLDRANAILNNFNTDTMSNFTILNYQDTGNVSFSGPYFWNNLRDGMWNDTYHLWWDSTTVSGDTPSFFQFNEIIPNTYLKITDLKGNTGIHYFESALSLTEAAYRLNMNENQVIRKYTYNVVYNAEDEAQFIQAVARYAGKFGDWSHVEIVDVNDNIPCINTGSTECNSLIYRKSLHVSSNPSWITAKFINDGIILPKLTWVMFVYDKCKISGKDKPKWSIKNKSDSTVPNIYFESKYLTYLFKTPGQYEIGLELTDSNGNKYKKERNILTIK